MEGTSTKEPLGDEWGGTYHKAAFTKSTSQLLSPQSGATGRIPDSAGEDEGDCWEFCVTG